MENENIGMETEEESGLVTFKMSVDEAKRLRAILSRKASGIRKPRIQRVGNQIIIDTGLDEVCTLNKGLPSEIHPLRIYQRAGSHEIDENGRAINPIPAITVVERVEGGYCYMDGKPVDKREDLNILPPEYYDDAVAWFDAKYGKAAKESEKVNPVPSPVSEPDEGEELTLKDKVIVALSKGLTGKQVAEKLGCSEGTVSVYRKKAIREKILAKDGKEFTSMGSERYGRFELNL